MFDKKLTTLVVPGAGLEPAECLRTRGLQPPAIAAMRTWHVKINMCVSYGLRTSFPAALSYGVRYSETHDRFYRTLEHKSSCYHQQIPKTDIRKGRLEENL
jgi:hypothetical protein